MALLLSDAFTRADSSTNLGSPAVGGPYTVQVGTWGISSNAAYTSSGVLNSHVTFPAAFNLDMEVTATVLGSSSTGPGLVFRWTDASNFWCVRSVSSQWQLTRRTGGTSTAVIPLKSQVAGDRLGVVVYEGLIFPKVNGVIYGEVPDHYASAAPTVAGLIMENHTGGRLDDLVVDSISAMPNTWGTTPDMELPPATLFDSTLTLTPSLYKGRDTAAADESEIP